MKKQFILRLARKVGHEKQNYYCYYCRRLPRIEQSGKMEIKSIVAIVNCERDTLPRHCKRKVKTKIQTSQFENSFFLRQQTDLRLAGVGSVAKCLASAGERKRLDSRDSRQLANDRRTSRSNTIMIHTGWSHRVVPVPSWTRR